MSTTNVTIRMDSELKAAAEKLFSELGLTMSAAVNVFVKQAVYEHGIPFELRREAPNAETIKAIDEVESGKGTLFTGSTSELMKELLDD